MRLDEAFTLLNEVESRLIESQRMDPKNKNIHENLAVNYNTKGRVLELRGDFKNALKEYQKAYAIKQTLAKDSENNLTIFRSLGFTLEIMADAYFENKQFEEALKKYDEAIALYKKTDIQLINVAKIKSNICRLYLRDHQVTVLHEHQNDLLTLEKTSREDTLNVRNIIFLSEFYGNTARALAVGNGQSEKSGINDPCYFYRRSIEFGDRLIVKKALSVLRMKKREELVNAMTACSD